MRKPQKDKRLATLTNQLLASMVLNRTKDGWYVRNPDHPHDPWGPYDTKAEAEADRLSLAVTYAALRLGKNQAD